MATDPVERTHFQMIWLLAQGKRVREVAEVAGYCANWIRLFARCYNQKGPLALADQWQQHKGVPPLLSQEQQGQLLEQVAPDGGLWTSRKVAFWIAEQTKRTIHPQRGWDYLQSGAVLCKTIRPVSVTVRSSTGGLPRFPKSNVVIAESILP